MLCPLYPGRKLKKRRCSSSNDAWQISAVCCSARRLPRAPNLLMLAGCVCAEAAANSGAGSAAVAVASRGGETLFVGQKGGIILAVDTATLRISDAIKV